MVDLMGFVLPLAADLGTIWNDTWKIATSVAVLFFLLWFWNWMMSNLGTF
jgi:hypothetical protein